MKKYYYSDGQQQFGPFSKKELKSNNINKETLVWYDGLKDWTKASEVEELADLFPVTPTPPPLPKQKTTTPPPIPSKDNTENSTDGKDNKKIKNKDFISDHNKKSIRIARIIIGMILISIIAFVVYENVDGARRRDEINRIENLEKNHPEQYLTLTNIGIQSGNILQGDVKNAAKYAWFSQVHVKVTYYDKNSNVLQSDIYYIDGDFIAGFSVPFAIQIREPQGIKNKLNWASRDAAIVGATPKY